MNLDSFYITLPSNSSMDYFPNNTMTDFTTVLTQPIQLNGRYEVALTEINYSPNFMVYFGKIIIPSSIVSHVFETKYHKLLPIIIHDIEIDLKIPNGIDDIKFCEHLNELIEREFCALDADIRQLIAYTKLPENIYQQAILNNMFNKKQTTHNLRRELIVFKTDDKKNVFPLKFEKNSIFYFVIDEEDSVYANDFKETKGTWMDGKWVFNDITTLRLKFDLFVITCEQKINENSLFKEETSLKTNQREAFLKYQNQTNKLIRLLPSDPNRDITYKYSYNLPKFEIKNSKIRVVLDAGQKINIGLSGGISLIVQNNQSSTIIPDKFYSFPNYLDIINYILIYTDFIENQYFGDSFSPILKIIPVKSRESSHLVTYFDNPDYVIVRTSHLTSINITLRDMQGDKIKFEDPFLFVIVKLHFKKIQ